MQELINKIEFHIQPIVQNLNLELWGIDVLTGAKSVVCVYLENAGIDECTQVSRLVGLVLDIEEIFSNAWVLEVSTPGLDRSFFKLAQMLPYINQELSVSVFTPVFSEKAEKTEKSYSKRKIKGMLTAVNEENSTFQLKELTNNEIDADALYYTIEWDNVKKAKIIPYFEEVQKPSTKQKESKIDKQKDTADQKDINNQKKKKKLH